jgi:succinate dehydrogenase/fumarate reductase cytochrome b subunit
MKNVYKFIKGFAITGIGLAAFMFLAVCMAAAFSEQGSDAYKFFIDQLNVPYYVYWVLILLQLCTYGGIWNVLL